MTFATKRRSHRIFPHPCQLSLQSMELAVTSSGQKCDKFVLRVTGEAGAALELALVRGMMSSLSPLSSLYARMEADNEVKQPVERGYGYLC